MSHHKKKHVPPIPPANQPKGPAVPAGEQEHSDTIDPHQPTDAASFQEQDAERRLGDYSGAGEHPRQQPGRANDGDVHSR